MGLCPEKDVFLDVHIPHEIVYINKSLVDEYFCAEVGTLKLEEVCAKIAQDSIASGKNPVEIACDP